MNSTSDDGTLDYYYMDIEEYHKRIIELLATDEFGDRHYIYFPIVFVVCIIGLFTNSINIVVFTRPNMMNPVNFLLTALSAVDLVLLLSQIPTTIHHMSGFNSFLGYTWLKFYIVLIFLETTGMTLTNWLAVAVGIFRLIYIRWQLHSPVLCSMRRAQFVFIGITVVSIILSGVATAMLDVFPHKTPDYVKPEGVFYLKRHAEFAENIPSVKHGIWASLLFCHLVPTVILVIITGMLIWTLVAYKRKRKALFSRGEIQTKKEVQDTRTTTMLIVLLFLFVLNNLPDAAINVAVFYGGDTNKSVKADTDFLRVFSMVNNMLSFFIYYIMSVNFRKTFKKTFADWFKTKGKSFGAVASSETCSSVAHSRKQSLTEISIHALDVQSPREKETEL